VKKQVLNALAIGIFTLVVCNSAQAVQCDFHAMTPGNVSTSIAADGSDFLYSYTVGAISNCDLDITSFALPYLPSADITSIESPEGWSYQISAVDSFGLGGSAGTLTWTAADGYGIPETVAGSYLSGFSYDSPYGAVLEVPARVQPPASPPEVLRAAQLRQHGVCAREHACGPWCAGQRVAMLARPAFALRKEPPPEPPIERRCARESPPAKPAI